MYARDIATCNEFTQHCSANLKRAALFVLATIQQQLETVPVIMADFERLGAASRFAFRNKAKGIDYLDAHIVSLYYDAMRARGKPQKLLFIFLRVPGLGIVKAGFLAQIFDNAAGCIDVHNVKLYDVPLGSLRYRYEQKHKTQREKRAQYIALCDGLGGSVALWSRWCDYLAAVRPKNWSDGADVSQFHVDVITGVQPVDLFSDVDYEPEFRRE